MKVNKVLPQQMVRDFCMEENNVRHLVYISGIDTYALYDTERGFYRLIEKDRFNRMIYRYLISKYNQSITSNIVKDVVNAIHWQIDSHIKDVIHSEYIALKDKLLNLNTFEYEEFSVAKPAFYNINISSADIDVAKCPRWLQFLDEVLVDKYGKPDESLKSLIQEMFGYSLLNTLEGHACFFLVGDGHNGKSVMLSVLRHLVGEEYAVSYTIENLTTNRFAPAGLIGKKLNISVEEESAFVKSDKFKALVSGDSPITIEYKYGDSFSWLPTVKFFFATNELPTFTGFNDGLLRRIHIIPFNKRIKDEERDTKLAEKLRAEAGGIVAWAILGAKRLKDNKYLFTRGEQARQKLVEFSGNLSSSVLFFKENYVEDENGMMFLDDLYDVYKEWAERRGKKRQSYYNFIGDLQKILTLPVDRARKQDGTVHEFRRIKPIEITLPSELPIDF